MPRLVGAGDSDRTGGGLPDRRGRIALYCRILTDRAGTDA